MEELTEDQKLEMLESIKYMIDIIAVGMAAKYSCDINIDVTVNIQQAPKVIGNGILPIAPENKGESK